MNRFIVLLLAILLTLPAVSFAAPTIEELQKQIADIVEELDDLNDRLDKPERHSALDRISFSGDLRTTADSIHYQDVTFNPGIKVDYSDFFGQLYAQNFGTIDMGVGADGIPMTADDTGGLPQLMGEYFGFLNGGPAPTTDPATIFGADSGAFQTFFSQLQSLPQEQQLKILGAMFAGGVGTYPMAAAAQKSNINNDIMYTTRLRLNMKADIARNMNFAGRLNMYKAWGDSSGSRVFDSWDAFAMDGTSSGKPSGDTLHVERAFFNWKDIAGSDFYFSVGRRPSTYGPPSNYRENELRGGTPSGHLVNFNFDGFTLGYHLSEITGIEGQSVRFCYGQGFESEYGNGSLFNGDITANLEDTHLGGFNIDVFNDGKTLVQATLFRAQDVVDGFTGVFAFPTQFAELFAGTLYTDMQKFPI
nr:DUF3373 family protein [uncultured Desulfuromusa sp.]